MLYCHELEIVEGDEPSANFPWFFYENHSLALGA